MSAYQVPVVQTIEARLHELLDVAREVKPDPAIEPPLASSRFQEAVNSIAVIENPRKRRRTSSPPAEPQPNGENVDAPIQQPEYPSTSNESTPTWTPHHAAFESAARRIFYSILTTSDIDAPAFASMWNLLDILQFCVDTGQCDPSLPLWLVEELLDSQTIEGCRRVFDYLESRRETLISRSSGGANNNKKMIVLRSCNELLRRLSRAEDAVFCGRVFVFLFGSFPLGDKSSVNLRGEFHTDNTTVFDDVGVLTAGEIDEEGKNGSENDSNGEKTVDGAEEVKTDIIAEGGKGPGDEDKMDVDKSEERKEDNGNKGEKEAEAEDATKSGAEAASKQDEAGEANMDRLYTIFWSLQHAFSNPTKIFVKEEFDKFRTGLELTLKRFKSTPQVLQTHGVPRAAGEVKRGIKRRRSSRADDEFVSNFNPKYLTSRDLFELEMSDLTFQRHILVQSLILLDFLLSLNIKAKNRLADLKAQRAMIYSFTLSDEDTEWAIVTRAAIAAYLQEGPDGKFYYRMADTVLSRDKNWVRWKVESCPPISLAPERAATELEARKGARSACAPRRIKAHPAGAMELGFLTDGPGAGVGGDLDALRDPARHTAPPLERYLREIEAADLDLEMAGPEERRFLEETRASAAWRVLRLAAAGRLGMFDKIDEAHGFEGLRPEERGREETDAEGDREGPLGRAESVEEAGPSGPMVEVTLVEDGGASPGPLGQPAVEPATEEQEQRDVALSDEAVSGGGGGGEDVPVHTEGAGEEADADADAPGEEPDAPTGGDVDAVAHEAAGGLGAADESGATG